MNGWRRFVAVVLGLMVLAGCTGVPTSGPVAKVSATPGRINAGVVIAPAPPGRNAAPAEVVEGYLHAMASWQPDYAVARAYLTPAASERWDPDVGVRVYGEGGTVTATQTSASLHAPLVGTLDPGGSYRRASGTFDHDFGLVRDQDGQWRIANPPDGLVISEYLFSSAYSRILTYFFAPGGSWLSPEARFFPRGWPAYEGAAAAVLQGPTEWWAPVIGNTRPPLELDHLTVTPTGVAQVFLRPGAPDLDVRQREAVATQLVWTFRQFEGITAVEVGWANGQPWSIAPYGSTLAVGAFPDADPAVRQGSRQLFGIRDGTVVRALEGPQASQDLPVAPGIRGAVHAAVRTDALQAAAVVGDRSRLVIAPLGEGPGREVAAATGMRRPHYDRMGVLWVTDDAGNLATVDPDTGHLHRVVRQGLGEGTVEAFRVSPDATRVAVVTSRPGGSRAIAVGRIEREGRVPAVTGWWELGLSSSSVEQVSALDIGWRSPDSLLVLADDGRRTSVYAVAQDGSSVAPIGPSETAALVELAVAPGAPPMVRTASGEVWRYTSDFRWSQNGSGLTSVFYPG